MVPRNGKWRCWNVYFESMKRIRFFNWQSKNKIESLFINFVCSVYFFFHRYPPYLDICIDFYVILYYFELSTQFLHSRPKPRHFYLHVIESFPLRLVSIRCREKVAHRFFQGTERAFKSTLPTSFITASAARIRGMDTEVHFPQSVPSSRSDSPGQTSGTDRSIRLETRAALISPWLVRRPIGGRGWRKRKAGRRHFAQFSAATPPGCQLNPRRYRAFSSGPPGLLQPLPSPLLFPGRVSTPIKGHRAFRLLPNLRDGKCFSQLRLLIGLLMAF